MLRAEQVRALLVVALLVPTAVSAHIDAPSDLRQLAADAVLIVRGHVVDARGVQVAGAEISTAATLLVEAVLKGSADSFITVIVPGGTIGRTQVLVTGAPRLRVGDGGIFLLRRGPDNVWRLVDLASGLYRVRAEPSTGRAVVYPPAVALPGGAASPIVRGDGSRMPMAVSEFEALVRLVVQGRTQPIVRGRP